MKHLFNQIVSCVLFIGALTMPAAVQADPFVSAISVASADNGDLGVFSTIQTPRTLLTIGAEGDTKLRLELPPLLAGLPVQVIELNGHFDGSSHSVSLSSPAASASCTLSGPAETECNVVFADSWVFPASRARSYVRTRGFSPAEVAGRESVISSFAAHHTATVKVRTRILF